jgi:hypothetical protein
MILQHTWQNAIYQKNASRKKLILLRAGLYCLGEKNIEGMTVCPRHWHAFGTFWRSPTTCQFPEHAGKTKTYFKKLVDEVGIEGFISLRKISRHEIFSGNRPLLLQ